MARVGRPRKPLSAHRRDSTFRPGVHGDRNEPKFGAPSLKPPASLDKLAKEEWKRLAAPLQKQGLFTMADRHVFAVYCQAVSDWTRLTAKLNAMDDLTYVTSKGFTGISPLVNARTQAWRTLRDAGSRFGLDPASRAALDVTPVTDGQTDEAYIFGDGPTLEQ